MATAVSSQEDSTARIFKFPTPFVKSEHLLWDCGSNSSVCQFQKSQASHTEQWQARWKLLLPAIVILIGLSIIIKSAFNNKFDKAVEKLNEKFNKDDESGAVFGGANINLAGKEFKGKNVSAVFGGLKLDLREAKIKEDVIINATAIFGGIDILVPENVIVETKSNSFFGGVSNKKNTASKSAKAPTVYVNGTAMFGGVEVK